MTNLDTIYDNVMKSQNSVKELTHNFRTTITEINNSFDEDVKSIYIDGKLQLKDTINFRVNDMVSISNPFSKVPKASINSNLNKSQRKLIAKRLHYVNKKMTNRNINLLFNTLKKFLVIEGSVKIKNVNWEKEKRIQQKRKVWIKLRNEAETALREYKKEKGNFYK